MRPACPDPTARIPGAGAGSVTEKSWWISRMPRAGPGRRRPLTPMTNGSTSSTMRWLTLLSRACSPEACQPDVGRLVRTLYEMLARTALAAEFPTLARDQGGDGRHRARRDNAVASRLRADERGA